MESSEIENSETFGTPILTRSEPSECHTFPMIVTTTAPEDHPRNAENRRRQRDAVRPRRPNGKPIIDPRPARLMTLRLRDDPSEAGKSSTKVPAQTEYTGPMVIFSTSALERCADLGIAGLLSRLNEVMGTSYTFDDMSGLSNPLEACIVREYDFGMAYGLLRPRWNNTDFSKLLELMDRLEEEDRQVRRLALNETGTQIIKPDLDPRRVWDLYSDRVVPFWAMRAYPWAVSHSWMDEKARKYVQTPVNANMWPVPIPTDSTLERVRIELLNLGATYVWLDVLCLRQKGRDEDEPIRIEEWKLDVPTIGNVYHKASYVVQYFSGLGRPFVIGDLTSPRHWLNRAWTLQEINPNRVTAGVAGFSPIQKEPAYGDNFGNDAETDADRFYNTLSSLQGFAQELESIFPVLLAMRGRTGTSELDKVAGLAYLLRCRPLPAYDAQQHVEEAWSNLLGTVLPRYRGDLLFLAPATEGGHQTWAPSWRQIMEQWIPSGNSIYLLEEVRYLEGGIISLDSYRIDDCSVRGFSIHAQEFSSDGTPERRKGMISIKDARERIHEFEAWCRPNDSIPEDESYTLIGSESLEFWVVGKANLKGVLRKVSVLRIPRSDADRLRKLELFHRARNKFI